MDIFEAAKNAVTGTLVRASPGSLLLSLRISWMEPVEQRSPLNQNAPINGTLFGLAVAPGESAAAMSYPTSSEVDLFR